MKLKVFTAPIKKISGRFPLSKKVGQPPGSLIYTGEAKDKPFKPELIQYNALQITEKVFTDFDSLIENINRENVNWIYINNLTNTANIEEIGKYFNIHNLTLEDILEIEHLPKIEEGEDHLFLTLKYIKLSEEESLIENHISLILGEYFLLSFADVEEDIFKVLRTRLESVKNKARTKKTDYLFYLLLDNLVDNYYVVFDKLYSKLEEIENLLIENPSENQITNIHKIKKELASLRKSLMPLEKSVNMILKDEYDLIDDANEIYFRDVHDHLVQLVQTYDSYREFISSLIELNSSNMNNNLNKTMKILTTITTIFIPLTFIAGIYGMNFKHMPELSWNYGYFFILGLMAMVGISMVIMMKRRGFFK